MGMRLGVSDATSQLVGAVLILLFCVYVASHFIFGGDIPKPEVEVEEEEESTQTCATNMNCKTNPGGAKCLFVVDPNYPRSFKNFCGCETKNDCVSTPEVTRGDVCGQDNKCT